MVALAVGSLAAPAVAAIGAGGPLPAAPVAGEVVDRVALPVAPDGPRAPGGARLDDLLVELLATTPAASPLRVVVHGTSLDTARAAVTAAGLRSVYELASVGVVVADGLPATVRLLGEQPGLTFLQADAPISYDLDHSHEATRGEEARTAYAGTGAVPADLDGSGVTVAVIDSGVDGTHPFFAREDGSSKVVVNLRMTCEEIEILVLLEGACAAPGAGIDGVFVPAPGNDSDTMANGGHGTHVAGIVAGVDTTLASGRTVHGAAPGSDLVVLGTGRALVISAAIPALQWVLDHHADPCGDGSCPPIRVLNNSWSGSHEYDPEDVVNKLQRALIAAGVTVVWAASNDGGDGTENMVSGYAQEPTPGAIAVANYDDAGSGTHDGALDASSSRGLRGDRTTYPDVSAPGASILSSCRLYLPVCTGTEIEDDGNFNSISGTSMAAPHVAGIVAQLLQADPGLTPAAVEDVLEDTAYRFTFGGPYEPELDDRNPGTLTSFDKGHGLVDVVEALGRVLGVDAPAFVDACVADGPNLTDPAGDAGSVLGVVDALPNEPSLDVRALSFDDDGSQLVAVVAVDDLGEAPAPTVGEGEYFDVNFVHAGRSFFLSAQRDATGAQTFGVGYYGDTGREGIDADTAGLFDPELDRIQILVPLAALADAGASVPAAGVGSTLSGIEVVSRRQLGVVIPDADSAPSACAYTIGFGNGAPPPAPPVEEEPDLVLAPGTDATWSGPVTTGAADPTGAGGQVGLDGVFVSGEQTVTRLVETSAAGTLVVELASDAPTADFDLYVLDAATGAEVASSATETSAERVEVAVPAGRYRVVVRAFLAVEATFTATAGLT